MLVQSPVCIRLRNIRLRLRALRRDVAGGWEVAAAFDFGGSLVSAVPEAADASGATEVPAASAPETTPVVSV